jgi:hypothetical protein
MILGILLIFIATGFAKDVCRFFASLKHPNAPPAKLEGIAAGYLTTFYCWLVCGFFLLLPLALVFDIIKTLVFKR